MTLTVNTAAMALGLFAVLWSVKHPLEGSDAYVLVAVYLILLKLALIVALAMLFSCFTTPFLAILFTAGMYLAGIFAGELRTVRGVSLTESTMAMLRGISYLLPNIQNFNVMGVVTHGGKGACDAGPRSVTLHAGYCAIVLLGAALIFSRRNLK